MARWMRFVQVVAVLILGLAVVSISARAQGFSTPRNVSGNSDFSFTPQVAVDSHGNIFMAWEDDTSTNANILFSRSIDGGVTFSAPQNISNASGSSFAPRMVVGSNGNVNVVWQVQNPTTMDIMFSFSKDGGATFSTPIDLSNSLSDSSSPQIATNATGNLYVAWENDASPLGIFFSRSTDGGLTFSQPAELSLNTQGSITPQLAVDSTGNVSVVWEDDSNGTADVSFAHSTDSGITFSMPMSLSHNSGNSVSPQIALDSTGNIDVAWDNNSPGNFDVFFSRSTDKGATFSAPKNVSSAFGEAGIPQIATDASGNISLVWADNVPPASQTDIYFSRSSNGGTTFSSPRNISNDSGFSDHPSLAIDAGAGLDVAWEDSTPGNTDIFFARSTDSGATFSAPLNLSNDSGLSIAVQMAADKLGNLDVTWQDDTPGPSQVFFSRLGGTVTQNQPPVAIAAASLTMACTGPGGTSVTLDGSKSSDPDGDTLSFVWTNQFNAIVDTKAVVSVTLPPGTYTYTLTVTDPGGLSSTAKTQVTITDTTPPALRVALSPNFLWPPNHGLVQITAAVNAADACDSSPAVTLVSITSNEPDQGLGSGDQPNDIQAVGGGSVPFGTDVRSFMLRAERSGMGTGRVYTVTYMARDAAGNESTASARVFVPKDSLRGSGISTGLSRRRFKRLPPRH